MLVLPAAPDGLRLADAGCDDYDVSSSRLGSLLLASRAAAPAPILWSWRTSQRSA